MGAPAGGGGGEKVPTSGEDVLDFTGPVGSEYRLRIHTQLPTTSKSKPTNTQRTGLHRWQMPTDWKRRGGNIHALSHRGRSDPGRRSPKFGNVITHRLNA
jgi:hypothetical protein